jgi:hypothetical protein
MVYLKKLIKILCWPYTKIRREIAFRKRLRDLRKQDPFIYK